MEGFKKTGPQPYPHKFQTTFTLSEFISKFSALSPGENKEDEAVSLAGMIDSCV